MDGHLSGAAAAAVPEATVFLLPGQLHVSGTGSVVTTILGSCVSVCLVSRGRAAGGINHFLLPDGTGHATPLSTRFGRPALQLLLQQLAQLGAEPPTLEAKLFGGSSVIGATAGTGRPPLGATAVALALSLLGAAGIPVVASDVGGDRGRKLVFDTEGGDAWVRLL